jgi:hypothetical protein
MKTFVRLLPSLIIAVAIIIASVIISSALSSMYITVNFGYRGLEVDMTGDIDVDGTIKTTEW